MAADAGVDAGDAAHYSFPVLTGIDAGDPLSTRAARMAIYQRFMKELDSTGKGFSKSVSEVDVTDPEDVKALLPGGSSEVLVHFGDEQFLGRYNEFEKHLPEWQQQYPKLASADMRYEGQIVLEMRKDAVGAGSVEGAGNAGLSTTAAQDAASGRDDKSMGGVSGVAASVKTVAQTRVPKSGPGAPTFASSRDGKASVVPVKAKAPAKGKPVAKPVVAKKAAAKPVAKPAVAHKADGSSSANEKMFAALAAQRKAAEAKAGGGGR